MLSFWENWGKICSTFRKWATFLCKTCTRDFCLVIIFFCSGSHSEGWMGKVLNCIKEERTVWALWRWHKRRGESTINVNAFRATSTSLIRPHLLLSTERVNRFLYSLVAWTYLLPMITQKRILLSMRWELEWGSGWSKPSSAHSYSPPPFIFLRPCVDQHRSGAALEVVRDIFDGELLMNLPRALKGGRNAVWNSFFLSFLPVIHIHPKQAHRANLEQWEQSSSQDMCAYITAEQKCCTCWVELLQIVSLFPLTWQNNRTDRCADPREAICNQKKTDFPRNVFHHGWTELVLRIVMQDTLTLPKENLWVGRMKLEMVGFYLCWWIVMGIEEVVGGRGAAKEREKHLWGKYHFFFQIYLHKLKCRQFTMAQWVSEKATCMGSSLHFHVFLQRVVLAPCLLKRRKYPFHSPWPHNIYSQDALYSCQSQIIRELVSCLMVQDCVTVQLMYAQNVNHFEQNAVHWCPWM